MLAAAVPVIAYDVPGPHVMLPPEYRVPVGAVGDMADRVCGLLTDPDRLRGPPVGTRPGGGVRLGGNCDPDCRGVQPAVGQASRCGRMIGRASLNGRVGAV